MFFKGSHVSTDSTVPFSPTGSFSSLWLAGGFCFGAFLATNQEGNRSFVEK